MRPRRAALFAAAYVLATLANACELCAVPFVIARDVLRSMSWRLQSRIALDVILEKFPPSEVK